MVPDRNTSPYSIEFYKEISDEVEKILQEKSGVTLTDVELILMHLKCLEGSVHQYVEQIKEVLLRMEKRNEKQPEVL